MKTLQKKIEAIMQDTGHPTLLPLERFLFGISRCYGGILKIREHRYQKDPNRSRKLSCMVISIGNITVGGTGKTPMTLYLADLIRQWGYRVTIVSRGYGGKASASGGIVSDGTRILLEADMAGDEPVMMARHLKGIPVVIGSNRYEAGMKAIEKFAPDIILLDDGFQHRRLHRDLDILLLDAARPFGNGHLLPRGPLRESVPGIGRADLMVLTRAGRQPDARKTFQQELASRNLASLASDKPLFQSSHEPYLQTILEPDRSQTDRTAVTPSPDLPSLEGRKAAVFSGIANNQDFHRSVKQLGANLTGCLEFPDHHEYTASDIAAISKLADESDAELIITTEKDAVKLDGRFSWSRPLAVVGVSISIQAQQQFQKLVSERILRHLS